MEDVHASNTVIVLGGFVLQALRLTSSNEVYKKHACVNAQKPETKRCVFQSAAPIVIPSLSVFGHEASAKNELLTSSSMRFFLADSMIFLASLLTCLHPLCQLQ